MRLCCRHCRGVALAVAVLLTGCGSAATSTVVGGASAPLTRIRASVPRTEAAATAQTASTAVLASPEGSVSSTGDLRFAGPDVSLVNAVSVRSGPPIRSAQILIGKTLYVRYLTPTGSPPAWSQGTAPQVYSYLGIVQPTALTGFRGQVRVVGDTVVGGTPVTEYALSLPAAVEVLGAAGSSTKAIRTRPFGLDLWLNRAGQIVRTRATQVAVGPGRTVTSTTTVTLSRFGEPVSIDPPTDVVTSPGGVGQSLSTLGGPSA